MAYTQDPNETEEQYYLDYAKAIQEQERYMSQDAYHRYSLGYSQFEGIPEDAELTFSAGAGDWAAQIAGTEGERLADKAVLSWRVEKVTGSQIGDLGQSMRAGSEIEVKDFVKQRGGHKLEGLHKAAAQGDRAGIMQYMKHYGPGAPINDLDLNGCSPLMYAAIADSILAIEMLLNFSARREKTDTEGRTAVHYAAFFGKQRALKFLIDAAADWTPKDVYGRTPLHWSAANRNTRCLTVLLKHASVVMGDINPRDNEGMTPVHCAAHFGRAKHILLLNEADADVAAVDIEGKTALHWTISNPDTSSALALVEAYPPLTSKRDVNGNSVLHLAASIGSTLIVDTLLKLNGIEIDNVNEQGRTALHLACKHNHPDTARLLLVNRASDAPVDVDGFTALHYAVETKSSSTVTAFDQLPLLTHVPSSDGRTPLMMAADYGMGEILSTLIKNRGVAKSVDSVDPNGRSALHLAAQGGSSECVTSLLSSGADPNLQDQLQQTPLFLTVVQGHAECVQLLVSGGCQPDIRDGEEQAPVHLAVLHHQVDCVQSLARSGADLNILDSNRDTALHMAAYSGDDQSTTTLLEYGANPNIQNTSGWSPVHYAAMEGHLECLATLVTHRAYTNFRDFSDESCTPMDFAVLNSHIDCMDVLTQGGALTTTEIRSLAAVSLQTAYRAYRARCELSLLKQRTKAVTVITSHVRGYLQRGRFKEIVRRHHAAVLIQSHVRGLLQRVKFAVQLSQYCAQKQHHQLMVDYAQRVASDRENDLLKTFQRKDFTGSTEDLSVLDLYNIKEQREAEKKLRLEKALQMREIFLEKQKNWKTFREAEQKRRDDKSRRKELSRYSEIVAESRARKEYNELVFQQTHIVRSHTAAAVIIQRAYRRLRLRQLLTERVSWRMMEQQRRREERAARIIQRAWREYQQYKVYHRVNYKKVQTSPVITLRTGHTTLTKVASYQKGISITGNPRRRVHQTEQSGFKLFRPTTRDLLFKPQPRTRLISSGQPATSTTNQSLSYMLSGKHDTTKETTLSLRRRQSGRQFLGKVRRGQILPELFAKDNTSTTSHVHKKTKLHLPNIVET